MRIGADSLAVPLALAASGALSQTLVTHRIGFGELASREHLAVYGSQSSLGRLSDWASQPSVS